MKTWVKWAIAAAVVIVVALVAGPFVYINFIKDDAPERFALDAPASTTAATATASTTGRTATTATTAAPTGVTVTAPTAGEGGGDGADGLWVIGTGSAVGYRVVEVLFGQDTEGVGRTDQVSGQFTLAGAAGHGCLIRGRHADARQ